MGGYTRARRANAVRAKAGTMHNHIHMGMHRAIMLCIVQACGAVVAKHCWLREGENPGWTPLSTAPEQHGWSCRRRYRSHQNRHEKDSVQIEAAEAEEQDGSTDVDYTLCYLEIRIPPTSVRDTEVGRRDWVPEGTSANVRPRCLHRCKGKAA